MKNVLLPFIITVFFLLICSSCQQENILEEIEPHWEKHQISTQKSFSQKDTIYQNHTTVKEEFDIDLSTYRCQLNGAYAVVFDPNTPQNMAKYTAEVYVVEWFQNGVMKHVGSEAGCFCGKPVTVIVTDLRDNISKQMTFTPPPCRVSPSPMRINSYKSVH